MTAPRQRREQARAELRAARVESRQLFWLAGLFSFFVNILMLTGPLYMLQVYDRVLGSRSVETLVALSGLVAFLFAMMGLLDYARGRIMGRAAARFQSRLDRRVFEATIRHQASTADSHAATALGDLESVQRLMASPVLMSVFDLPWTPLFVAGIWIFHPWLGTMAVAGGATLVMITLLNQHTTNWPARQAAEAAARAGHLATRLRDEVEIVQAMGMRTAAFERWHQARAQALAGQLAAADLGGSFTVAARVFRLFLQSAMLGLGAYLVLRHELTAGTMIAGSILLGRALAPVEQTVMQWPQIQSALKGWHNLVDLLAAVPPEAPKTALPRPRARLDVRNLTVVPPGEARAALRGVSFTIDPGEAVGVVGPSAAGKSSLARAITGVWPPVAGEVRLDGARLDQYPPETRGRHIGYLPQQVQLFDGTIAENIARLALRPDAGEVVAAARRADAHEMILDLPDGYDTPISAVGARLSGGQMQRIGLARALYGDPVIVVLDEPNSNLDNEGSNALNAAIRGIKAGGRAVLLMAHRPAAIRECDRLLMLENGMVRAYGPVQDVLRTVTQNHAVILGATGSGGVR